MININGIEWGKLTYQDIVQHLNENCDDETFFFELKKDEVNSNGLTKEICAFANTYGGYIFIGVDDNKNITGSPNWTEEKINNIIYNNISPTPSFDIKKFVADDSKQIFVIKVEEGIDPPYISTTKGIIYNRVSSSSCPVKDAYVLNHLYNKRTNNMSKLKDIIGIDTINPSQFPDNLCATLDVGFSFVSKDATKLGNAFTNANLEEISHKIKSKTSPYSITRLGHSYVFTLGNMSSSNSSNYKIPADLHHFIEVMPYGTMRYRILLGWDVTTDIVDIGQIFIISDLYKMIYYEIFGEEIAKQFVCAYKYEYLHVYKQFVPVFNIDAPQFKRYLTDHQEKYGENHIVTSARIPKTGYNLIDKQKFEYYGKEYNSKNLSDFLIGSDFTLLGYIDPPKQT